jgi:GMP synthase (glutamine-hydrolysing)
MFEPREFIKKTVGEIRKQVPLPKKALIATSGGVDSTTCAMLARLAIGNRAQIVFIDDGLMRKNEGEELIKFFKSRGIEAELVDRKSNFFRALEGIVDPEEKRKAFREVFYRTLGELVKVKHASFLIQGTIKVDVVETAGGIKTQHNVLEQIGISPTKYGLRILEPLKEFYKPEVRAVAKELGLPKEIYQRMPFPGPGLATRIVGEVTPERVQLVRKASSIVEEAVAEARIQAFQAFAVLLEDKATGVRNKKRLFGNIIVIRIVQSKDALTAKVPTLDWKWLENLRDKILAELPRVSRVLYDLTPKPPATIEYI